MRGFSLIEAELSLLVLSVGALAAVGLYSLGFRESAAARDDVLAAAAAEGALSRVVSALSDTNLTWSAWKGIAETGEVGDFGGAPGWFGELPEKWASRLSVAADEPSRLCVRVQVAPRRGLLDSAPVFYSEVRFQGRVQ